ncbi:MAG: hypothetical protein JNM89_12355 [Hyphomicrobiaceae bacterium]|nr:hypothetical protein [Hyphomicrobiaceae bacterium]
MTRASLNKTLRRAYVVLVLVLIISLAARLSGHLPLIAGTSVEAVARDVYEYLKDMALVLVTVIAAYLANVFQKRSNFVESLEQEWRGIVRTKSALFSYCEKPYPSTDDYIAAYCRISETIDNMRIVYKNAGETDKLIGLYPYAPLHDMRRALQSIDPRARPNTTADERRLVQDAILQSFFALRESFLEELDLDEPRHPLLISGGRRLKTPGSARRATAEQDRQRARLDGKTPPRPDVDALLERLYDQEKVADAARLDRATTPPAAKTTPPRA